MPAPEPRPHPHPHPRPRLVADGRALVTFVVKWVALGSVIGVLAGLASAGFLATLHWATDTRLDHPWLLFLLPVAGLAIGLVYHHWGADSAAGNNLILDEIHEPQAWIPRRMAPLIYASTVVTQLFGGSAGREGTAIQMAGSIGDLVSRTVRLGPRDRRLLLIASIAGGFGSVFGVPLAGFVFALEVQAIGRMRRTAVVPALVASVVGDLVVRGTGVHHLAYLDVGPVHLSMALIVKVVVLGLACGLVAAVFIEATHGIRRVSARFLTYPPLRPFIGGLLVIALTGLVGSRAYLGLSEPLIVGSLAGGVGVATFAFAWKLLFTSVTLGSGFQGGEVTPLLVIGATLGATLGRALGVPGPLLAAIGFVAVFAGASNTPIACTIMGVELFGSGPVVLIAIGCVLSYLVTHDRSIYTAQVRSRRVPSWRREPRADQPEPNGQPEPNEEPP